MILVLTAIPTVRASNQWDSSTKVTLPETSSEDTGMAYDSHLGKMFIAWAGTDLANTLNVESSSDLSNWGNKVVLPYSAYTGNGGAMVDITYDGSNQKLYVSYSHFDAGSNCLNYLVTSSSDGVSWSSPVQVSNTCNNVTAYGFSIAYSGAANQLVATADNQRLQIYKSTDGITWSGGTAVYCNGVNPNPANSARIRYANGNYFLSFSMPGNGFNIFVMKSSDLVSWGCTQSTQSSYDPPTVEYYPGDGLYHLEWHGTGNNNINDATSSDGVNWGSPFVSSETTGLSPAITYDPAISGQQLALLWVGTCFLCNGQLNIEQYTHFSNNAAFVSQTAPPSRMCTGQTANVGVTMQNTGSSYWAPVSQDPYNPFRLGAQNPQDNTIWGFNRVELQSSVPPGNSYTFSFTITAPSTPGTYNFQWRMVQEGVQWFGSYSSNVQVIVVNCTVSIHIHTYPTTDIYCRSVGLAIDQPLPVPWWPPYQSGYQISPSGGVCGTFDYTTSHTFQVGSHYVQTAVSGFTPNYAWHTIVYINGVNVAEGDVGRNQILQANFNV
jgi:hypothetical protein